MIIYHRTSILTSQAQTVVNTVNTVGVMGKGLASEYKKRHPNMFKQYKEFCTTGLLDIGKLWLWKGENEWVLNFPTKKHWRNPSKIEYVRVGLEKFVSHYEERGITEIAFPRLGCGNGGLKWEDVRPLMEEYLGRLPIPVYIHDFEKNIGLPEHHQKSESGGSLFDGPERGETNRSFSGFIHNIEKTIQSKNGVVHSIDKGAEIKAHSDGEGGVILSFQGETVPVFEEDIFDLWVMLLKGPVNEGSLTGSAVEAKSLLFSVLAELPNIRPIQIVKASGEEELAVEMIDDRSITLVANQ